MSASPQLSQSVAVDTALPMDEPIDPEDSVPPGKVKQGSPGRRKWWIFGIIIVVAVLIIGYLWLRPSSNQPTTQTRTQDATASMTTIQTTVGASGTINPAQRADLTFSSAGTVNTVNVAVGDAVKSGDALAAIDLTDLQSAVDAAQSAVDAAKSDYNTAVSAGGSSKITAAKSTLTTKQNALDNAKTALANGTLTAPFDGTVAIVNVSVGDKVGGSSSGGGNTGGGGGGSNNNSSSGAAITVISTDTYQVTTSVGSADVGSVKKGQDCTVTPNGTNTPLPGTVESVGVIATSSDASGATFPVSISITGSQKGLYAGVSASISIVTSSRQALTIPTSAITYENGTAHVQLKTDSGTTDTVVQVGTTTGGRTEITSGLNDGDTVVITITITSTSGNGGGLGGFQTMFGGNGGGNRQRPTGGYGTAGGNFPGGFPTGGNAPTGMQPPQAGPTS